jgi:hypothetical protein
MQMLTEIGTEQNTMTVVMIPGEFVEAAKAIGTRARPQQSLAQAVVKAAPPPPSVAEAAKPA